MFGYAYLMKDFNKSIANEGLSQTIRSWKARLERLAASYTYGAWSGNLFLKTNPLWSAVGILKPAEMAITHRPTPVRHDLRLAACSASFWSSSRRLLTCGSSQGGEPSAPTPCHRRQSLHTAAESS